MGLWICPECSTHVYDDEAPCHGCTPPEPVSRRRYPTPANGFTEGREQVTPETIRRYRELAA